MNNNIDTDVFTTDYANKKEGKQIETEDGNYIQEVKNIKNQYKKAFIFQSLNLINISSLMHTVWNIANIDVIHNNLNPVLEIKTKVKSEDHKYFKVIYTSILNNIFIIDDENPSMKSMVYLPLINNEFKDFLMNNIYVIEGNVENFVTNYNYLESKFLEIIFNQYNAFEFMISKNSETKYPTSTEIKDFRDKFNNEKNSYFPSEVLNSNDFTEEEYVKLSNDEKFELFIIVYTSMNPVLLDKILMFDHGVIYKIIQEKDPMVYFYVDTLQKQSIYLYAQLTKFNRFTTLGTTVAELEPKEIVLNFFGVVRLYPNFIQLMQYEFSKIDEEMPNTNKTVSDQMKNANTSFLEEFNNIVFIEQLNV